MKAPSLLVAAVVLLMAAAGLLACDGHRRRDALSIDQPSRAADAILEQAATLEERRTLERVRDEIDLEMKERVRALDAEIQALQQENEQLRRELRRR